MKVFLLKDIEKVGCAGEMIKVQDGYAINFLFPRKLAIEITPLNEKSFIHRVKVIEKRQEVVASKTSMLAEKIKALTVVIKRKMHDNDKLYGAITEAEIVDGLKEHAVSISKSQVVFDKSIKTKGSYTVTIKLSSQLKPQVTVKVIAAE